MSYCACVTLIKFYICRAGTQNIQSLAFSGINADITATQQSLCGNMKIYKNLLYRNMKSPG